MILTLRQLLNQSDLLIDATIKPNQSECGHQNLTATEKPLEDVTSVLQPGTNQSGMREQNERLVLTLLRRRGPMAKAEIARATGLSAQTVSVIIRALETDCLLAKGERQRGRVGQPSVPMTLNPDGAFFLGLKVGRRSTEVILTDFVGTIRARRKQVHHYPDFDSVLSFATQATTELIQALPSKLQNRVGGIGLAMPFHLWSWAADIGVDPTCMVAWKDRDLKEELSANTGHTVFQQNDATSACSAELVFGTDTLPANFLHVYVAFFVGGGLVLDRALFTGARGNAAGMGPLRVPDRSGQMRPLIDQASLVQLETSMTQAGLDSMMLWDRATDWDIPASILDAWVDQTAFALSGTAHAAMSVLDLDAMLIDGWMPSSLRSRLVVRTAEHFAAMDQTGIATPAFRAGSVGPDARALGAASLPLSARWLM